MHLLYHSSQLVAQPLRFYAVASFQTPGDPCLQILLLQFQLQIILAEVLLVDHFPEGAGAHGTDAAVFHKQDGIRAVYDGVEIMGDHNNRTPVGRDGIFQRDLGKGVQMAGGFIQKQEICISGGQLGQLQQIFLTAGELAHFAAQTVGVEAVFLQVL